MIENAHKFQCGACGNDKYNIFKQLGNDEELFVKCLAMGCNSIMVISFTQPKIKLDWHENGDGIMAIF